jgi:hypothetical protein
LSCRSDRHSKHPQLNHLSHPGDDTIIINASNIAALEKTGAGNRARVDGGGGIDTLKLEGVK